MKNKTITNSKTVSKTQDHDRILLYQSNKKGIIEEKNWCCNIRSSSHYGAKIVVDINLVIC